MNDNIKYINREQIKDWLLIPSYTEQLFENYYRKTGKTYTIEYLFELPEHSLNGLGMTMNTDFASLRQNYTELKRSLYFSETDWIQPFYDISLHRHLRFFPEFYHSHSFFEICYVYKGECTQNIFKNYSSVCTKNLFTGDILIIPPSTRHSISMLSDSVVINILVRMSTFESALLKNIPSNNHVYEFLLNHIYGEDSIRSICCHTGDSPHLQNMLLDMAETYCNNDIYASEILNQMLGLFFTFILRDYGSSFELIGDDQFSKVSLIPSILHYISTNYSNTSVIDVAHHFGYNPAYLERLFKKGTGTTLIDTISKVRIEKAIYLLINTKISIDMICDMIGYNDTTYFIRIFKKYTGQTPLQYRKHNSSEKSLIS